MNSGERNLVLASVVPGWRSLEEGVKVLTIPAFTILLNGKFS